MEKLGRGYAWIDAGSPNKLLDASNFIQIIEKNQSEKIGCIEEISFKNGWITKNDIKKIISKTPNNNYTNYLKKLINK